VFQPTVFAPILLLQVIYKAVWLVFYVLPRLRNESTRKEIHWGIAGSFLLIVMLYPASFRGEPCFRSDIKRDRRNTESPRRKPSNRLGR
jgi:hypothetical protein